MIEHHPFPFPIVEMATALQFDLRLAYQIITNLKAWAKLIEFEICHFSIHLKYKWQ